MLTLVRRAPDEQAVWGAAARKALDWLHSDGETGGRPDAVGWLGARLDRQRKAM